METEITLNNVSNPAMWQATYKPSTDINFFIEMAEVAHAKPTRDCVMMRTDMNGVMHYFYLNDDKAIEIPYDWFIKLHTQLEHKPKDKWLKPTGKSKGVKKIN